ncbi:hypothetical protein D9M71_786630 [compost metagenome]
MLSVEANRQGVVLEQIHNRRAIELHVVQRGPQALDATLANIQAQFDTAHMLEHVPGQGVEHVQAGDIDEQELVLEREIFLQVAITAKGVEWIRD